jgi:hypothetical protein
MKSSTESVPLTHLTMGKEDISLELLKIQLFIKQMIWVLMRLRNVTIVG